MSIQGDPLSLELASRLLRRLGERSLTASTAESITGGLVAASITSVPGSSESFLGGVVAYATEAKASVLGVDRALLEEHGPVSEAVAGAMAQSVRQLFGSNLGVATTGVAGPEPVGDTPPGTLYVAACVDGSPPVVRLLESLGSRLTLRQTCVTDALRLALDVLGEQSPNGE